MGAVTEPAVMSISPEEMANFDKQDKSCDSATESCTVLTCCKSSSRITSSDRKIICGLLLANVFYGIMVGIIVPFYAIEATGRGLPQAAVGAVVCLYSLTMAFGSVISGQMIPVLGASKTLHLATLLAGSSTLAFTALAFSQSAAVFLVVSCVLRALEALACAALYTASATIIANRFPDDTSFWIGVIDNAMMVGAALGPAMGGGLYAIGGLALPFAVLGCTMLLVTSISWYASPVVGGDPQRVYWLTMSRKMVRSPEAWLNSLILVVVGWMWSGLDPYIEVYGQHSMALTPHTLGLCFLLSSVGGLIGGPLFGRISDMVSNTYPQMAACLLLGATSLIAIGPAGWTGISPSPTLLALGLTIRDFALTGAYIPIFVNLSHAAADVGLADTLSTQAYISGLLTLWYALGMALGPLLVGVLSDAAGFPTTAAAFAATGVFASILVAGKGAIRCWLSSQRVDVKWKPLVNVADEEDL